MVSSALWAAAGDALGWITELTDDYGLESRTGLKHVSAPVEWRRVIGGRFGTKVKLPAGSYSDDTQLRLAVCRAIRGNGSFDAEAFAKIELTVWPSYALGGGRATKAAATNLARRDVNWFSNFFDSRDAGYLRSGGNGAAMRIQPHLWACPPNRRRGYLLDVLRNALITHGHPHGFCGAALHALMLDAAVSGRKAPSLEEVNLCIGYLAEIPEVIDHDPQLAAFWRSAWEQDSGVSLADSVTATMDEARRDVDRIRAIIESDDPDRYRELLSSLGCLEPRYRGSGLKTAMAAGGLLLLTLGEGPEHMLVRAANILESDTDTIATMAGALRGVFEEPPSTWQIQDRSYIEGEARRLSKIAQGQPQDSFAYPDPARWRPPVSQGDAVAWLGEELVLLGLGRALPEGQEFVSRDGVWQWLRLPFGQTVLAKRRKAVRARATQDLIPGERRTAKLIRVSRVSAVPAPHSRDQGDLPLGMNGSERDDPGSPQHDRGGREGALSTKISNDEGHNLAGGRGFLTQNEIDWMTDRVIHSNFDDLTLGKLLNRCIDRSGSLEGPVAFTAIVAKAKLARQKRAR